MKSNDYPQLVLYYTKATEKIFGKKVWVSTMDFSKFRVLEDDLREIGASSKDYAYTVLSALQYWTKDHHMDYVPVGVFCGKFAFQKFGKIWKSETVSLIDTPDAELRHSERMVAEMLIARNMSGQVMTNIDGVVSELRPLLSRAWLEMYDHGRYRMCSGEIIDELCAEYHVEYAKDYQDLVREIMKHAKQI
jgi:hypothetical protein